MDCHYLALMRCGCLFCVYGGNLFEYYQYFFWEWLARLVSQADCSGEPIPSDRIPELEAFWRELRRHAKGWGVT